MNDVKSRDMKTSTQYWCMACGAWCRAPAEPCDLVGHITQKYTYDAAGTAKPGATTIAADYQGRLQHLSVKVPS